MRLAARWAFIDGVRQGPTTVSLHDRRITAVRPWRVGDPPQADGMLLPGLVNAHLHTELSWAHGLVPGGQGFDAWVHELMSLQRPTDLGLHEAIAQLHRAGTVGISDLCSDRSVATVLGDAGLAGVVHHELFTRSNARLPSMLARAQAPPTTHGKLVCRVSPHALYSTPPALRRATIEAEGLGTPATIHVSEDLAEHTFLRIGEGPWPSRLDAMGLDWRPYTPTGRTPIGTLAHEGLLHDLLLVHGVHFSADDRALIADSNCSVVLCPRSNLHIGGQLPQVRELLTLRIPVALGTDSLASSPDLDVLGEVPVLREAFPDVPVEVWLHAATFGGASALRLPWAGRLAVGYAPGILLVHPEEPWRPRDVLLPSAP